MKEHKIGKKDRNYKGKVIILPDNLKSPMYEGDDYSSVTPKEYKSREERKIDWLCDGIPLSERQYKISLGCTKTKFVLRMLPIGRVRTGEKIKVENRYIVIHETNMGTEPSPIYKNSSFYSYKISKINEIPDNYDELPDNEKIKVGYHFLCDDDTITCFIPWDEIAYHAGSAKMNFTSIGIERLVRVGTNFPDAIYNQAKLVATLMYMCDIPLRRVMTHLNATYIGAMKPKPGDEIGYDENGQEIRLKNCPSRMLAHQYGGLGAFMQEVVNCLRTKDLFLEQLTAVAMAIESKRKIEELNKLNDSNSSDEKCGKKR